jgi:phosphoribosylamine--glycine ligase
MYLGLMISAMNDKPYLLEYNCRMGDPETQNIALYLEKNNVDFLDLIGFDNEKYPDNFNLSFIDDNNYSGFCCTIVLAAKGYPDSPVKDFYLDLSNIEDNDSVKIFHAGTKVSKGAIKVTGGRILTVNAFDNDKQNAIDLAYENIYKIKAYNDSDLKNENNELIFFRTDIGS